MHRACGKIAKAVADGKAPAPAAVELPAATGTAGTAPGAAVQHGPNLGVRQQQPRLPAPSAGRDVGHRLTLTAHTAQAQAKQFLEFIGVDVADSGAVGRLHFSPQRLLQVCDSSVERAAELYFSKGDMVAELAPKDGSSSAAGRAGSASSDGDASAALREALEAASAPAPPAPDAVRVSCGAPRRRFLPGRAARRRRLFSAHSHRRTWQAISIPHCLLPRWWRQRACLQASWPGSGSPRRWWTRIPPSTTRGTLPSFLHTQSPSSTRSFPPQRREKNRGGLNSGARRPRALAAPPRLAPPQVVAAGPWMSLPPRPGVC